MRNLLLILLIQVIFSNTYLFSQQAIESKKTFSLPPIWDGFWLGPTWQAVSWRTHAHDTNLGTRLLSRWGDISPSAEAFYSSLLFDLQSLDKLEGEISLSVNVTKGFVGKKVIYLYGIDGEWNPNFPPILTEQVEPFINIPVNSNSDPSLMEYAVNLNKMVLLEKIVLPFAEKDQKIEFKSSSIKDFVKTRLSKRAAFLIASEGAGVAFYSSHYENSSSLHPSLEFTFKKSSNQIGITSEERNPDIYVNTEVNISPVNSFPEDMQNYFKILKNIIAQTNAQRELPPLAASFISFNDSILPAAWDGGWMGPRWGSYSWMTHGNHHLFSEALLLRDGKGKKSSFWFTGLLFDLSKPPVTPSDLELSLTISHELSSFANIKIYGASAEDTQYVVENLPIDDRGIDAKQFSGINLSTEKDEHGNLPYAIKTLGEDAPRLLAEVRIPPSDVGRKVVISSDSLRKFILSNTGKNVLFFIDTDNRGVRFYSATDKISQDLHPKLHLKTNAFSGVLESGRKFSVLHKSISDEEFFGSFSGKEQADIDVRINYSLSDGLQKVKNLAENGDYSAAKNELLRYFREERSVPLPELPEEYNDEWLKYLEKDIYVFDQQMQVVGEFQSNSAANWYATDATLAIMSGMNTFGLYAVDNNSVTNMVASRESKNFEPRLFLKTSNETIELMPKADTYITSGEDKDQVFGSEKFLKIRAVMGSEHAKPYGNGTSQAYVNFDIPKAFDYSSLKKATLRFYSKSDSKEPQSILITAERPTRCSEEDMTWSNHAGLLYNFNGLGGGFHWDAPVGAHGQYIHWIRRLHWFAPLVAKAVKEDDISLQNKAVKTITDYVRDSWATPHMNSSLNVAGANYQYNQALHLIDNENFTGEIFVELLKRISLEMDFLAFEAEENTIHNIGVAIAVSMMQNLMWFPEVSLDSPWEKVVIRRITELMDNSILPDGSYVEHTFGYPFTVLGQYLNLVKQSKRSGYDRLPDNIISKINQLATFLMNMSAGNGFADNWGEGGPKNTKLQLKEVASFLNDPELLWWTSGGEIGRQPSYTSVLYPNSEIAMLRNSWGDLDTSIFVSGQVGGWHTHRDALHVGIFHNGIWVFPDTGMTTYDNRHPHFDWQRHKSRSHNTIEINKDGHPVPRGSKLEGVTKTQLLTNDKYDFYSVSTEAYPGFPHHRDVFFMKEEEIIVVHDLVVPKDVSTKNVYDLNWHVHPRLIQENNVNDLQSTLTGVNDMHVKIEVKTLVDNSTEMIISNGFNSISSKPTQYMQFRQEKRGRVSYLSIISLNNKKNVSENKYINLIENGNYSFIINEKKFDVIKNAVGKNAVISCTQGNLFN